MRILGYTLLLLGFFWLVIWHAPSVMALTRAIAIENFQKYQPSKSYSGDEVSDAIRNVLDEYRENSPGVVFPAVLMLLGGCLLDVAGKHSINRNSYFVRFILIIGCQAGLIAAPFYFDVPDTWVGAFLFIAAVLFPLAGYFMAFYSVPELAKWSRVARAVSLFVVTIAGFYLLFCFMFVLFMVAT